METIFAEATAPGRAGVSIVRISGPAALKSAKVLAGDLPESHQVAVRPICGSDGGLIDQGLVLVFKGPASFTGEDVVELHLHGSIAIVRAVLSELGKMPDMRLAEAGEFTRRALTNGKMDLAQVEGLGDLIDAETEAQRKQALQVFSGELGNLVESWRADLIRAAALLEATIDFVDEDVPVDVTPEVLGLIDGLLAQLDKEIKGSFVAERVRVGFEVAIVGPPNAGKSTLLNMLAGRDAAITSEIAGTTRDVVEVRMDLQGLPVTLLDTAGLRGTTDVVEGMGVERALSRAKGADLRVFLAWPDEELLLEPLSEDIVLHPMADKFPDVSDAVSGKTGYGVPELISRITDVLAQRSASAGIATHARHRLAMTRAVENLMHARDWVGSGEGVVDLAAAELRSAVRQLEMVLGRIDVENLLDEIFSSFCIGK